tara:strand:+ start:533 stop:1195 length:663 start_codon:yes stop_codon:yes gene_type:complete
MEISPSKLNYSRKVELDINDNLYYFTITDVHIEIDFEILGKNSYNVWISFYNYMCEICINKKYYIICKNFHYIKCELLEIFHIFLRNKNINFIICTQHISYIPCIVKKQFKIIVKNKNKSNMKTINNYKRLEPIINIIINKEIDYFIIREKIYDILTYNLDINEAFTEIIFKLFKQGYFENIQLSSVFKELLNIIQKYNNNYRSVYHIECFVIYLIQLKT